MHMTHLNDPLIDRTTAALEAGGRVLVSRLQYVGDVVLSLPMVKLLRERFPAVRIDYLARGAAADILIGEAAFDRIHRMADGNGANREWPRMLWQLRRRRYALAIDLYSNPRSAIAIRMSGAPMRIGGTRRLRRRLYTHIVNVPREVRAATQYHIAHLAPFGIHGQGGKPSLEISAEERSRAREMLERYNVDVGRPVVGVHPGGKWEVKRWPAQNFSALSRRLIDVHRMQVVVMHGPGEAVYRDELKAVLGDSAVYLPVLPIRDVAAIIEALDAVVVSDGGVMHISVAVGTPTVGVFGSAEPDIWFPYERYGPFVPAFVPIECRPCHSHVCSHISCLRGLTPAMVEEKLLGVLATETRPRSLHHHG